MTQNREAKKVTLAVTAKGQVVTVLCIDGKSARVSYANGRIGWLPVSDIEIMNL